MRALWTSASALRAQQIKLDTLANDISNVNTTGFKSEDVSFQELLQGQMSTLPQKDDEASLLPRTGAPDLRLANGVRAVRMENDFSQGAIKSTEQPFDLSIQGEGFFQLISPEDVNKPAAQRQPIFTRDGHFHLDAKGNLVNDQGYRVMDQVTGNPITIDPALMQGAQLTIDSKGNIVLRSGSQQQTVASINYVLFAQSPDASLTSIGNNLFALKPSSLPQTARFTGAYYLTAPADLQRVGTINQGTLELSNVDLGKSMADLIQMQRAYGFNSRAIQTTDEMMGMSNNMRSS